MTSQETNPIISELQQLIRWKQSDKAVKLIRQHVNSNLPINQAINHETALHLAAQFDDDLVMTALFQVFPKIINVNCRDYSGSTPLHLACSRGNTKTSCILLKYGANVNATCDRQKQTPAHYAAEVGSLPLLRLLKKFLAKLDLPNSFGNTPLHRAAYHNHRQVVQFLLEEGANPSAKNNDDQSPLYMAIVYGDLESVSVLVSKYDADFEARVSTNYDKTMLQIAIQEKKDIITQYLVNKGADVNCTDSRGVTPLHEAASEQNFELCNLLLQNGADVNVYSNIDLNSPLHISAQHGNAELMELFIAAGANVNCQNQQDKTPLHLACKSGVSECVEQLLEAKAKRFIPDCYGKCPLECSANDEIKSLFSQKMRWPSHLKVSIPYIGKRIIMDTTPRKEMNLFPENMMRLKKNVVKSGSPLAAYNGKRAEQASLLATAFSETAAKDRVKSVAGKIALRKHAEKVNQTIENLESIIKLQQKIDPTIDVSYYSDYVVNLKETTKLGQKEGKENSKAQRTWDPYFAYNKSLSSQVIKDAASSPASNATATNSNATRVIRIR